MNKVKNGEKLKQVSQRLKKFKFKSEHFRNGG
jgi:hypothetical protein